MRPGGIAVQAFALTLVSWPGRPSLGSAVDMFAIQPIPIDPGQGPGTSGRGAPVRPGARPE